MSDLFFAAARHKYRFTTSRGIVTTEDLFNLKLPELNLVAKGINALIKEEVEEDFLGEKSAASTELTNKLEIVKAVIRHKQALDAAAKEQEIRAAQRQQILAALHAAKQDELKSLTVEELEKKLAELS